MCFETLRQRGLGWLYVDDTWPLTVMIVMTIMAVVTEVLNPNYIIVAMMGTTIQLWLMWVVIVVTVTILVEPGLTTVVARMEMVKLRLSRRHLYHSWVQVSLKRRVGNRIHDSLVQ